MSPPLHLHPCHSVPVSLINTHFLMRPNQWFNYIKAQTMKLFPDVKFKKNLIHLFLKWFKGTIFISNYLFFPLFKKKTLKCVSFQCNNIIIFPHSGNQRKSRRPSFYQNVYVPASCGFVSKHPVISSENVCVCQSWGREEEPHRRKLVLNLEFSSYIENTFI